LIVGMGKGEGSKACKVNYFRTTLDDLQIAR